jgi:putative spermidine/putrescine transport system substrate-binding protein
VVAAAALIVSASYGGSTQSGSMTFNTWGGAYQAAQEKAIVGPFEKQTGIDVTVDNPIDYAKLKAMVVADNVTWDVADVEPFVSADYCRQGLLEKLDFKMIPKSRFLPEMPTTPCSVPNGAFTLLIAYRADKFKGAQPKSWADFFDLQKFPGKRAMPNYAQSGDLEAALIADGVPRSKLYPINAKRAFAKLDTIKKDIVWWSSGDQSAQLVRNGEVAMCACWVTRMHDIHKQGTKVKVVWNGQIYGWDDFVIPKGAPNKAEAMRFIAFATNSKQEIAMTRYTPWGPSTKFAAAHPSPKTAAWIPTTPAHKKVGVPLNYKWWSPNADRMTKQFTQWQLK